MVSDTERVSAMNRKYLTLHEAISEGRADWANVQIPANLLPPGRKCLNQFCENLFCQPASPGPVLGRGTLVLQAVLGNELDLFHSSKSLASVVLARRVQIAP